VQGRQSGRPSLSVALGYVPSSHAAGSSSDAPIGQKLPRPHGRHLSAPVAFWYVPALHGLHTALREPNANVPARHATGVTMPVVQAWPSGQSSQPSAESRFVLFE